MKCNILLFVLLLALVITGCGQPIVPTSPPTPTATDTPLPTVPPSLTLEKLRNAQYSLPGCSNGEIQSFQLTDGAYTSSADVTSEDYTSVSVADMAAFGDLDGDGVEDAVVVIGLNCGGTGVFTYLAAVRNDAGAPVFTSLIFLDDRPMIENLSIGSGEIVADVTLHGVDDAMCCPSVRTRQGYRLFGGELVYTNWVTWTPENQERVISVSAPTIGAEVTNPFTISGEVTIAPFENTLAYKIYLPDGTLVNESPTMVDSGGVPGAPGTFSQTFDLSNAGITGPVLIQFLDLSAQDGSVLAMGSVMLTVH